MDTPSSPLQLTPRRKIQALLASISDDNDSDKENNLIASKPKIYAKRRSVTTGPTEPEIQSSEGEDVVRPRNRGLIGKLQTAGGNSFEQEENSDTDGNAYDRVRRRLLGRVEEGDKPANPARVSDLTERSQTLLNDSSVRTRIVSPERSTTPRHRSSPGLFLSDDDASVDQNPPAIESEDSSQGTAKPINRLKELVARKREERLAKEKAARNHEEERSEPEVTQEQGTNESTSPAIDLFSGSEDDDKAAALKLTQQARPTRKASKKALDDMHRETQRLNRNRQLAHEARTKTKFTKESLFAKFGFSRNGQQSATLPSGVNSSSSVAGQDSDNEASSTKDTPPSSPPSVGPSTQKDVIGFIQPPVLRDAQLQTVTESSDEELPDFKERLARIAQSAPGQPSPAQVQGPVQAKERISVKRFAKSAKRPSRHAAESDDDLEIVQEARPSRLAVFDRLPAVIAKDSHPLRALRALAHIHEIEKPKKHAKPTMTSSERDQLLRAKAREQARREREEKIQRLKDKGVIVMSAEEKEKEQLQIENMLEKARQDADDLAKREKAAAKKEGGETGNNDLLDSDESDAEWQEGQDNEVEVIASGSEEEEADDEEEDGASDGDGSDGEGDDEAEDLHASATQRSLDSTAKMFVDGEASEEDEEDEKNSHSEPGPRDDVIDEEEPVKPIRRVGPRKKVVDSEDEEEGDAIPPRTPVHATVQPKTPKATLSEAFGFAKTTPGLPGLSQVFAGTMAESQPDAFGFAMEKQAAPDLADVFANTMADHGPQPPSDPVLMDSQQFSMAFLGDLPPPTLPKYNDSCADDSQGGIVRDSQATDNNNQDTQMTALVRFETQSQLPDIESQSQMPDPTQDVGFQPVPQLPGTTTAGMPTASHETVSTVSLDPIVPQSPSPSPVRRPRRLVRAAEIVYASASEDETAATTVSTKPSNAFDVMRTAAARGPDIPFDKKRSEAKRMFEEQAEESEDEYAGLGGASDDESQGELDEETKKMIDDEGKEKVDEADIAAFYADKERASDEAQINRLYRDIANGGLRRKRGADLDLFDSDDEDEAAARRRAAKQREFARMRKAMLADERLGKIAQNPKQAAFLAAIADRSDDEDIDIFDVSEETESQVIPGTLPVDSQLQSQQPSDSQVEPAQPIPLSLNTANTSKKRTYAGFATDDTSNEPTAAAMMPPPRNPRRTPATSITLGYTRPTSMAQIRSTLSEMFGDHNRDHDLNPDDDDPEDAHHEEEDNIDLVEGAFREDSYREPITLSDEDSADDLDSISALAMPPPPLPNPRRTPAPAPKRQIIDRMSLAHRSTSMSTSEASTTGTTAWNVPSLATAAFRRPASLLRRATTAASSTSSTGAPSLTRGNSAAEGDSGVGRGKETVKMGGNNRSGVNWYAREEERKARIQKLAVARGGKEEGYERSAGMAEVRRRALGGLAGGFE